MREFKKRRTHREELLWLGIRGCGILLLFIVTALAVRAAWGMYGKMVAASDGEEATQAQLTNLEAQQQGISTSVETLSSSRGEEAQMRERFGVAKPGEGEIDIVRDAAPASTTPETKPSWWQRLFHALFVW